jgi:hypothetical protein
LGTLNEAAKAPVAEVVAVATRLASKRTTTVSLDPKPDPCTATLVVGGPIAGESVIAVVTPVLVA